MSEVERLSPNHNARSAPIRCIVLHSDASPSERATLEWLQNPDSKVSYHVLVGRDGTIYRIVPDERRAWACGVSAWQGVRDLNSVSLSAAFANRNDHKEPITEAQVVAMHRVLGAWRARWHIEDVTTHAATARPVGRKTDPLFAPNFRLEDFVL